MKIKPYDGRHDLQIKTLIELIQHKAAEHSYKGEWSKVELDYLIEYLKREIEELNDAVTSGNVIEALREAGDVGVCLMMIVESLMRSRTLTPEAIDFVRGRVKEDVQDDKIYGDR